MKPSSKLLIGLPVLVLLAIALCLQIAHEYKQANHVSVTAPAERVPVFSIITIKGRAFTAHKAEETSTGQESVTSSVREQKPGLFPLAYQLISRGLIYMK